MTERPAADEAVDAALAGLAEQVTAVLQRGEASAVEAILERHPAYAMALQAMLPTLGRLVELAGGTGPRPPRRLAADPDPRTTSGL